MIAKVNTPIAINTYINLQSKGTYHKIPSSFQDYVVYIYIYVEELSFLPEASFGLRVLSSAASVGLCVSVCVSITSLSAG